MSRRLLWIMTVAAATVVALVALLNLVGHFILYHPHGYGPVYRRAIFRDGIVQLRYRTDAGG